MPRIKYDALGTDRNETIVVPHRDGKLIFLAQPFSGDDYESLRNEVHNEGLRIPTASELVSFTYHILSNGDVNREYKNIVDSLLLDNLTSATNINMGESRSLGLFHEFREKLGYKNGEPTAYLVDDCDFSYRGSMWNINQRDENRKFEEELARRLRSGDPEVRMFGNWMDKNDKIRAIVEEEETKLKKMPYHISGPRTIQRGREITGRVVDDIGLSFSPRGFVKLKKNFVVDEDKDGKEVWTDARNVLVLQNDSFQYLNTFAVKK